MRRMSHSTSTLDRFGLTIVAALDALCYPLILVGASSAPHLTFAALRALVAGVVLAGVAIRFGRPIPREPRTWAYLALIGVGTISFGYLGMFRGSEFVSPGMATTITHVQPFIAALLPYPLLAERPTSLQVIGLMLGFGGVLVIAIPPWVGGRSSDFSLGFSYLVIAATGVATGNVLTRKVAGNVDPIVATSAQCLRLHAVECCRCCCRRPAGRCVVLQFYWKPARSCLGWHSPGSVPMARTPEPRPAA